MKINEFELVKSLAREVSIGEQMLKGKPYRSLRTYVPTYHRLIPIKSSSCVGICLKFWHLRKKAALWGRNPSKIDDAELAQLFERRLSQVINRLNDQPNMKKIDVNHNLPFKDPGHKWNRSIGLWVIFLMLKMLEVVNAGLYRQRSHPFPASPKSIIA